MKMISPLLVNLVAFITRSVDSMLATDAVLSRSQIHRFLVLHKQLDADDGVCRDHDRRSTAGALSHAGHVADGIDRHLEPFLLEHRLHVRAALLLEPRLAGHFSQADPLVHLTWKALLEHRHRRLHVGALE